MQFEHCARAGARVRPAASANAVSRGAATARPDDLTRPRKLSDYGAWLETTMQTDRADVDYWQSEYRQAAKHLPQVSAARWCLRMCRGWYCWLRLDRRDAGPMVHALWNYGEPLEAIEACKSAISRKPQNVYAYLHIVDLLACEAHDYTRAYKYYARGIAKLTSSRDRELLESLFLYTMTMAGD